MLLIAGSKFPTPGSKSPHDAGRVGHVHIAVKKRHPGRGQARGHENEETDKGEADAAEPAQDLTQALDGASAEEKPEKQAGRKEIDRGEMTSRLLKAKRRARESMKDDQKKDE